MGEKIGELSERQTALRTRTTGSPDQPNNAQKTLNEKKISLLIFCQRLANEIIEFHFFLQHLHLNTNTLTKTKYYCFSSFVQLRPYVLVSDCIVYVQALVYKTLKNANISVE